MWAVQVTVLANAGLERTESDGHGHASSSATRPSASPAVTRGSDVPLKPRFLRTGEGVAAGYPAKCEILGELRE